MEKRSYGDPLCISHATNKILMKVIYQNKGQINIMLKAVLPWVKSVLHYVPFYVTKIL